MTLLMRRPFRGITRPKVDMKGCILYTPFYRPDMVAQGGGIVNGTGVLDVSPQGLSVGVNTITATGAGTFIITIPEGGVCASGTATITGSPVTIPAGIATSVTTGVTTGNFTVTPSDIIRSQDPYYRACTITGAPWTAPGYRALDGDDLINFGSSSTLHPALFTWGALLQIPTSTTVQYWLADEAAASGFSFEVRDNGVLQVQQRDGGGWKSTVSSDRFDTNTWLLAMTTFAGSGNAAKIIVNGAEVAYSAQNSVVNFVPAVGDLCFGNAPGAGGAPAILNCKELFGYERALSVAECMKIWQEVKARHGL